MDDGITFQCDDKTVFPIQTPALRKWQSHREHRSRKQKFQHSDRKKLIEYRSIEAIVAEDCTKISISATSPIQYREEPHPVPPLLVGMWASTNSKKRQVSIRPQHLDYVTARFKQYGYSLKRRHRNIYIISPNIEKGLLARYTPMPTTIPQDYFAGTPEQRIDVLRGFVLARGTCYSPCKDRFFINCKWKTIPRQIQILCESLGIRTELRINEKAVSPWSIVFKTRIPLLPDQTFKPGVIAYERRYIKSVEEIEPRLCAHIETDADSFAIGEGYIQCR